MKRQAQNDSWQPTQMDQTRFERAAWAPDNRVSLRDVLTVAFHDRKRIGAALLLGMLLTALAVVLVPKKYTAEASLLLRLGREYLYTPEVGDPNTAQPVSYDREQTMLAEAKILTSTDVIDGVVKNLSLPRSTPTWCARVRPMPKKQLAPS